MNLCCTFKGRDTFAVVIRVLFDGFGRVSNSLIASLGCVTDLLGWSRRKWRYTGAGHGIGPSRLKSEKNRDKVSRNKALMRFKNFKKRHVLALIELSLRIKLINNININSFRIVP